MAQETLRSTCGDFPATWNLTTQYDQRYHIVLNEHERVVPMISSRLFPKLTSKADEGETTP